MDKVQELNDLFTLAQNDATVHSFDETQKLFLSSLTPNGNVPKAKKILTFKNWMIMLTTIGAITSSILFLIPAKANDSKVQINGSNLDKKPIVEASGQKTEEVNLLSENGQKSFVVAIETLEKKLMSLNP